MKKFNSNIGLLFFSLGLMVPNKVLSQGTLYLSNLGDVVPRRAFSVGADRPVGMSFQTGDQDPGYVLNSIDLLMTPAEGTPTGFSVSIYDSAGMVPGTRIGSLMGPDPAAGGLFNYVAEGIVLAPSTDYFVAVSSLTPLETGTYFWHSAGQSSTESIDGWNMGSYLAQGNGTEWVSFETLSVHFSVYATAIPEPSTLVLLTCGGLFFAARLRRLTKRTEHV